jgi:hypothetical protein
MDPGRDGFSRLYTRGYIEEAGPYDMGLNRGDFASGFTPYSVVVQRITG